MRKILLATTVALALTPAVSHSAQITQDQVSDQVAEFGISDALPWIFLAIILLTLSSSLTD